MIYQTRVNSRFHRISKNNRFKQTYNPDLYIKKARSTGSEEQYTPVNNFKDFNLKDILRSNIVYKGYQIPTAIQDQAILPILEGKDLIGLASTGTGKTAAFLIPLIQKLAIDCTEKVLVITPTRELALQIQQEFKEFAYNMKLYSTTVIGGTSSYRQIYELRKNPHVVIATPGRLKDLIERREICLGHYKNVVLDEVDLMVDIGFIADIKYFTSLLPKQRQSLFFSATIPPKVQEIIKIFVKNPVSISIKKQESTENIDQDVIRISKPSEKIDKLHDLLIQKGFDKVLIFGSTKHGINKLHKELELRGFKVGIIHGNKTQSFRQKTLRDFKEGRIKLLLATDVASRGLDIPNVTHVINYELPLTYNDYIHRIGRTGRANKKGTALTFC
ncbi:DEAD/DEAH box helicase [Patescibacteria group bacterium]|nr:DEAD/DEAH box helicase [Patescibacteria group bacterium]MBU1970362.1 DEAD/DEAH box helicase [Patescibacteria group bacterium]